MPSALKGINWGNGWRVVEACVSGGGLHKEVVFKQNLKLCDGVR